MKCEKCKKEFPEENTTCPFCGYDNSAKSDEAAIVDEEVQKEQPVKEPPVEPEQITYQAEPKKKGKKLKYAIIAAAIVVIIAIAVPVSLMAVRTYNYKEAVSLLKDEKFEQAKKKFEKLDGYKNSKKNIEKCDTGMAYEEASALIEKEDYKEAQVILEDLAKEKYKDSADLKLLCENKQAYAKAQSLLDSGDYYDAYNAFKKIEGFEDAKEKAESCVQPMPSTSELYRNEAYAATTCPIEITRTSITEKLPVVLKITTEDDIAVSTIFMAAGDSFKVNLPAGSYKINLLMGINQWFGTEEMFGELAFERQMNSGGDNGIYVLQDNYTYTLTL